MERISKSSKRLVTLLEIMIALAILMMVSGAVYLTSRKGIAKKRFEESAKKLKQRFFLLNQLAITRNADWTLSLKKNEKGWLLTYFSDPSDSLRFPPLQLSNFQISWNEKEIKGIEFIFFSNGVIAPEGNLLLTQNEEKLSLKIQGAVQSSDGNLQYKESSL